VDFNWSPQLCYQCRSLGNCEECIYITDRPLNVRRLITLTPLPELWWAFQSIIAVSPLSDNGFSLVGASSFLEGYAHPTQVTHGEFWNTMRYFLGRLNEKFIQRQKAARS